VDSIEEKKKRKGRTEQKKTGGEISNEEWQEREREGVDYGNTCAFKNLFSTSSICLIIEFD
jgi:hypothetical protein